MTKLLVCIPLVLLAVRPADAGDARFQIDITEHGFEPKDVAVPAGKPVTIVFDRKTDRTCAKHIVLELGDGKTVEKDLPLDTPVEIAATFAKPGKLTYACGMNMMKGTVTVQ
jgi:plastocyanin domain-containing protein